MKWLSWSIAFAGLTGALSSHPRAAVNQTTCASTTYRYTGLEGYGRLPSNARDKYGDTIGGIGSSIAFDPASWRRTGRDAYAGIVYCLPDRGWNTNGTINFQSRIHKFHLTLQLAPNASAQHPSKPNLHLNYKDTILLTDPDNKPLTSLDPDVTGSAHYDGFPPLPAATYPGDGFGGLGEGGRRVSVDPEGLALSHHQDGSLSFWVSDEYGPYVYRFSAHGRMEHAIQPPPAFLPRRNGTLSFNAASPPLYDPDAMPVPEDPASGRSNNQGLEALTLSPDGRTLYTMIQSALAQEGGPDDKTNQPVRLLEYDISSAKPHLKHEYAVLLPRYTNADGDSLVAAQSEIHHLPYPRPHHHSSNSSSSSKNFLVLSRDSDAGHGQAESRSVYRHADIFSITDETTDLRGKYDGATDAIASSAGELHDDVTPAQYCPFIDYNVDAELAKFGLHNGGPQDEHLLNEKWESLALLPLDPHRASGGGGGGGRGEYLLFSFSDNDFMTQDGHMNFGQFKYADESGYNLDTQVLVFRVEF